jgi:hypothetical protein
MKTFLIIFFSMVSMKLFSQKKEFDAACKIIQALNATRFIDKRNTEIIIDNNVINGDIDVVLYLQGKIKCDTLEAIINNELKLKDYRDRLIKPLKDFDPKESKYFSWKALKRFKDGIKISFVKFDGKFLRVNAIIGKNIHSATIENTYIEYQFVFTGDKITQLDWVERKY